MYQTTKLLPAKKLAGTYYVANTVQGSEILAIIFRIVVTDASGGIDVTNPVIVSYEQSWTEGKDWEATPYNFEPVTGNGVYKGQPVSSTPRLSPLGRVKIVIPAGESATVEIYRPRLDMRDVYTYQSSDLSVTSTLGFKIDSLERDIELDTVTPANNTVLPVALHGGQGTPELAADLLNDTAFVNTLPSRKVIPTISAITGYDTVSDTRVELAVDTNGTVQVADTKKGFQRTIVNHLDYTLSPIVGGSTETIEIPADFEVQYLKVFDSSGELYSITTLANPDLVIWVEPGGTEAAIHVAAGDTIQLVHATALGADKTSGFRALTLYGKTV